MIYPSNFGVSPIAEYQPSTRFLVCPSVARPSGHRRIAAFSIYEPYQKIGLSLCGRLSEANHTKVSSIRLCRLDEGTHSKERHPLKGALKALPFRLRLNRSRSLQLPSYSYHLNKTALQLPCYTVTVYPCSAKVREETIPS